MNELALQLKKRADEISIPYVEACVRAAIRKFDAGKPIEALNEVMEGLLWADRRSKDFIAYKKEVIEKLEALREDLDR